MGYWNYRVMSRGGELAIHEVHYDDADNVVGWSESPSFPAGEFLEELAANLEQYADALSLPVLQYDE